MPLSKDFLLGIINLIQKVYFSSKCGLRPFNIFIKFNDV